MTGTQFQVAPNNNGCGYISFMITEQKKVVNLALAKYIGKDIGVWVKEK